VAETKFPLGMPQGSVRAITYMFTHAAVLVALVRGLPLPVEVVQVWIGMTAFYHGGRLFETTRQTPKK